MDLTGEFYIENRKNSGGEGGIFLTASDGDEVSLKPMTESKEQLWRYNDGVIESVANGKVLTIYGPGSKAPILALPLDESNEECQKFYFKKNSDEEEDWVFIGQSVHLKEGFNGSKFFLYANPSDNHAPMTNYGSIENNKITNTNTEQKWRIIKPKTKEEAGESPFWWEPVKHFNSLGEHALVAGQDGGHPVYVSLVEWMKNMNVIGKIHRGECYVNLEGREVKIKDGDCTSKVLCVKPGANVQWIPAVDGKLPQNAIEGGEVDGKIEFVGRCFKENDAEIITPGRVIPDENIICFTWGGGRKQSVYDVLTIREGGEAGAAVPNLSNFKWSLIGKQPEDESFQVPTGWKLVEINEDLWFQVTSSLERSIADQMDEGSLSIMRKIEEPSAGGAEWIVVRRTSTSESFQVPAGYEVVQMDESNFGQYISQVQHLMDPSMAPGMESGLIKFAKKIEEPSRESPEWLWLSRKSTSYSFIVPAGYKVVQMDESNFDQYKSQVQHLIPPSWLPEVMSGLIQFARKMQSGNAPWIVVKRESLDDEFDVPSGYEIVLMDESNFGDYLPQVQHLMDPSMGPGMEGGFIKFAKKL